MTIIEALSDVLEKNAPICMANHAMLHDLIPYRGVGLVPNARAQRVDENEGELVAREPCERIAGP